MYEIITAAGTSLGMCEKPLYIRLHAENECFVPCSEAEATGIAVGGKAYQLIGRAGMDVEDSVELREVNAGDMLLNAQQAIKDADELNVDHEYRLTLLELGIADDTTL